MAVQVRPVDPGDREWVRSFIGKRWGRETVAGHGGASARS